MRAKLDDRTFKLERDDTRGLGRWWLEMFGVGLGEREGFDDLETAKAAAEKWATRKPRP
jgi:hypothetical protein